MMEDRTPFEQAHDRIVEALRYVPTELHDGVLKHIAPKRLSDAVRETLTRVTHRSSSRVV
jgi:hypothetical protein